MCEKFTLYEYFYLTLNKVLPLDKTKEDSFDLL